MRNLFLIKTVLTIKKNPHNGWFKSTIGSWYHNQQRNRVLKDMNLIFRKELKLCYQHLIKLSFVESFSVIVIVPLPPIRKKLKKNPKDIVESWKQNLTTLGYVDPFFFFFRCISGWSWFEVMHSLCDGKFLFCLWNIGGCWGVCVDWLVGICHLKKRKKKKVMLVNRSTTYVNLRMDVNRKEWVIFNVGQSCKEFKFHS